MFYTYLLYRSWDPLWRYVGKGSGYRELESMKEHGADSFRRVFSTSDEMEAFRMEDKLWIELTKRGYVLSNSHRPGRYGHMDERSGWKTSEETKRLLREKMIGKRHTQESRKRISQALAGRKPTPETVIAQCRARRTPEGRQRARDQRVGQKATPETRLLMSTLRTGKSHSPETIEKIRLAMLKRNQNAVS